jgi:hypothetical protein
MDNLALLFIIGSLILIGVGIYFHIHDKKKSSH